MQMQVNFKDATSADGMPKLRMPELQYL